MIKQRSEAALLNNAAKALRSAVRKVLVEKKRKGYPAVIWENGKVVKVPATKL